MRNNGRRRKDAAVVTIALVATTALTGTTSAAVPRWLQDPGPSAPFDAERFGLDLEPVADGFEQPVYVTDPDDGSGRLFVVEQTGRVRILENGSIREQPFLDLSDQVSGGYEQGLLSLAFAPDYPASGDFYVFYTDLAGDEQVVRY